MREIDQFSLNELESMLKVFAFSVPRQKDEERAELVKSQAEPLLTDPYGSTRSASCDCTEHCTWTVGLTEKWHCS